MVAQLQLALEGQAVPGRAEDLVTPQALDRLESDYRARNSTEDEED